MITTSILTIFAYEKIDETPIIETTKTINEVNITDTGIAESVNKVYDSVVVIKAYINNQLYSTGTGFVFQKDENLGYILTNNHVINSANKLTVTFTNGSEIEATLVGNDEYSDIAVLSVSQNNIISVAKIGSSQSIRIGDTTFAVGAPLDSDAYSWSVTRGIISGKDRLVEVTDQNNNYLIKLIQTDAAINSGNSGGPLCNVNGEVIGITNLKIASSLVEGMGFAIPIEDAINYATKFINNEKIIRPYLGITIYDTTNITTEISGIYIDSVLDNSPAAVAGLKRGDIITKINDYDTNSISMFKYELYKYNIGDTIKITYIRNNKENTIETKLFEIN